jgi:histidinol-phosphate aminotransferase
MSQDTSLPQPRPGILNIDPYVPGRSRAQGTGPLYKLSSNETPLGPSKKAIAAFQKTGGLELYPDGSALILRQAIADHYSLDKERIVCGNGSDDLLHLLAAAYVGAGDEGIFTEHGFLVYKIAILAAGGKPIIAPEKNLTTDVDAILARVTAATKIVYIANPNNPTGTYISKADIIRLHNNLAPHILLVIDGAYAEYVQAHDYTDGIELAKKYNNVVVTHTFSKIHGLASLRIGWLFGSHVLCDTINRIRGPFNLNGPALAAGAAAVTDQDHINASIAHNHHWLNWLTEQVIHIGYKVTPSVANFILIHFSNNEEAKMADEYLYRHNVIVRGLTSYGLPHCLRVTIGSEDANKRFIEVLSAFHHQSKAG